MSTAEKLIEAVRKRLPEIAAELGLVIEDLAGDKVDTGRQPPETQWLLSDDNDLTFFIAVGELEA